jgi:lactoylglutathione lyase
MTEVSLHHVALWVRDLDQAADFWKTCFEADVGAPYLSQRRPGFVSRFATLPGGLRVEIMTAPWIAERDIDERMGWDHIALSLGSREAVDAFATRCKAKGCLAAQPRETGDGFYEAIVQAPNGSRIEVTI